jgi:hypothetical protein
MNRGAGLLLRGALFQPTPSYTDLYKDARMDDPQFSEEDMEFLNSVWGPEERTPKAQASIDALESLAAQGNKGAKQALEEIVVTEAIKDYYAKDLNDLVALAMETWRQSLPELVLRFYVDVSFRWQFSRAMDAIQRSAYTRGWIARDKCPTT